MWQQVSWLFLKLVKKTYILNFGYKNITTIIIADALLEPLELELEHCLVFDPHCNVKII